jgi:3-oxoacyl-[acyl-carrier protein] reductase
MISIDLSNKTALITGATGELGRVIARTLAQSGANIIVHYHSNETKAKQLQQEIQQLGRQAFIVQAEMGQLESVQRMQAGVAEQFQLPDIIVANAVSQYKWTSVLEQNVADYVDQFNTTVLQLVHATKAFVPHMIEQQRGGRVIAINTECAMQNFPTQSAYVAGKRGMDGVCRVLAREIGEHQITVNQVAPGWTISERDRLHGTERSEGYDSQVPLRRRGTDQEIANVVAFLASDLASFITGAYVPVAGGNVMPTI